MNWPKLFRKKSNNYPYLDTVTSTNQKYIDYLLENHNNNGIVDKLYSSDSITPLDRNTKDLIAKWSIISNGPYDASILEEFYEELTGFRRLTGTAAGYNASAYDVERILLTKVSRSLYRYSPAYRFIVDYPLFVFFGQGLQIMFDSPVTQRKFDAFVSKMRMSFVDFCYKCLNHLEVDGELFVPIVSNNGTIEFSSLNPLLVTRVFFDDRNKIVPVKIQYAIPTTTYGDTGEIVGVSSLEEVDILHFNSNYFNPVGKIIYHSLNNWFGTRGRVDYEVLLDWCYKLDRVLETRSDLWRYRYGLVYDVTMEGADEKRIRSRATDLRNNPPSSTSYLIHNEKEKWNILEGKGSQAELIQTDLNAFKGHVALGSGFGSSLFALSPSLSVKDDGFAFANVLNFKCNNIFIPLISVFVDVILAHLNVQKRGYSIVSSGALTAVAKTTSITLQQTAAALEVARKHGWLAREDMINILYRIIQRPIPNDLGKTEYWDVMELNSFFNTLSNAVVSGIISQDEARKFAKHIMDRTDIDLRVVGTGVGAIKLKKKDVIPDTDTDTDTNTDTDKDEE